jgi:hypothetical protein
MIDPHAILLALTPVTTPTSLTTDVNDAAGAVSTVLGYLAGAAGLSGGAMIGYHALSRNLNDDPQAVSHHTSSMKKVAIGTVLVVAASGIGSALANIIH